MENIIDKLNIWASSLDNLNLTDLDPKKTAIISVDMIKGFCNFGNLSNLNYDKVASRIVKLFNTAYDCGFRNLILIQDMHDENSTEFKTFPLHAFRGSFESDTIDVIKNLSFFDTMKIFYKNSLSIAYSKEFNSYLELNPHIDTFIVVGVCTDLCVYNTLSHLALSANEYNIQRRIIVGTRFVATYDAKNHNSEFCQHFFLHHSSIALGIEIYRDIL